MELAQSDSLDQIQSKLSEAAREAYKSKMKKDDDKSGNAICCSGPWVCDIFQGQNACIVNFDGKKFAHKYTSKDGSYKLGNGQEVEVIYRTVGGKSGPKGKSLGDKLGDAFA